MDRTEQDAQDILQKLNIMGCKEEEIGEIMADGHPTLQQGAMRMVVGFLKAMASKPYPDGRNEASCKLAKRLLKNIPEDELYLSLV